MKATTAKTFASGTRLLPFILLLAACATSSGPPPKYYTLTPLAAPATVLDATVAVSIGPFELPDYLDRPQMITRTLGSGLRLEDTHRWAESLEDAFVRTLATNVSRRLGSDAVHEFRSPGSGGASDRVSGTVQRFDVDEDGRAILEVQWSVIDRNGVIVAPARRQIYHAVPADPAEFSARVDALSSLLDAFAADVAAALQWLPGALAGETRANVKPVP